MAVKHFMTVEPSGNGINRIASLWVGGIRVSRIWYRFKRRTTMEIGGVLTLDHLRKRGHASLLLRELLAANPGVLHVTTPSATPKGKRWLVHNGFTHDARAQEWMLTSARNVNTVSATKGAHETGQPQTTVTNAAH